jgi:hypothetical protein
MAERAAFERDDGSPNVPGQHSAWPTWVSATETVNFCADDPLLDWLDLYGAAAGFGRDDEDPRYDARTDFAAFRLQKAREFEDVLMAYLPRHFRVVRVATGPGDARDREAVHRTWRALAEGAEIIAQAVLWNAESQTYGVPDLLVRSDMLGRLVPGAISPEHAAAVAPDLPEARWHYRVVDIKCTTLRLLKNGSAGSHHDEQKVQLWIYNEALGRLQGLTPGSSYLLGRRWDWSNGKERGRSALERLARVDQDEEGLAGLARTACEWVRRVRQDGTTWRVDPEPSCEELRPSLRRGHGDDHPWHKAKERIGARSEDLMIVPRVSRSLRSAALAKGLRRWTDPGCTAAALGIGGTKNPAIVDAVLQANRSDGDPVSPAKVTANEALWRVPTPAEFYVDFETVNDLDDDFSRFPEAGGQTLIFMIGCGYLSADGWQFRVFTVNRLTEPEEGRIIGAWLAHMHEVCGARGTSLDKARLFHWSPAEESSFTEAYNSAAVRHGFPPWDDLPWVDLLNRVVKEQPITVRGAFGFGLKAVAKALRRHGLIETEWTDGPTDGLGAMVGAWWCEHEAGRTGAAMPTLDLMREIERYNEVDCRVMADALDLFRRTR